MNTPDNMRQYKKYMQYAATCLVAGSLLHSCGFFKKKKSEEKKEVIEVQTNDTTITPNEQAASLRGDFPTYGIYNYEQILDAYSVLTGVDHSQNDQILDTYELIKTSLPNSTNEIKYVKSSHQTAIMKLAVSYCDAMIGDNNDFLQSEELDLKVDNVGDYGAVIENSLNFDIIAGHFIDRFWGVGLSSLPNRDESINTLREFVTELRPGLEDNPNPRNTVKAVCTVVLASLPTLTIK